LMMRFLHLQMGIALHLCHHHLYFVVSEWKVRV
jgi:hypothetical protein